MSWKRRGGIAAVCDGVDEVSWSEGNISPCPHPRMTGAQGGVDSDATEAVAFRGVGTQEIDVGRLTDGENYGVGRDDRLGAIGKNR